MKLSNRVELTWRGVPPPQKERDAEREQMRWLALRMLVATGLLSLLSLWMMRWIERITGATFPTPALAVLVTMFNSLPVLLLLQSRFGRAPSRGAKFELREKSLTRNGNLMLAWSHYKAFRVIDGTENRKLIELIARDNYSRTIPMPADVAEQTVLDAIARHLEPYSLTKHGVVKKRYPFPTLAAWTLAGTNLLVLLCIAGFHSEIMAVLGQLQKADRGAVLMLFGFLVGPLAFLLWYPMARSQLVGVRRDQLVLAVMVSAMCSGTLAMPLMLMEPIGDTFETLSSLSESERRAWMQTVKTPRDLEREDAARR